MCGAGASSRTLRVRVQGTLKVRLGFSAQETVILHVYIHTYIHTYIHNYIHMIPEAQASSSEDKGISEQEGPDIDLE